MATVNETFYTEFASRSGTAGSSRQLHRIREVREREEISLKSAARALGVPIYVAREQEQSEDLHISDLYAWQQALDVPLADLLVESESPLSAPVLQRARMVKLMKTTETILRSSSNPEVSRLAERMMDELLDLMPELQGVGPWPAVGQRRSLDELGRARSRSLSLDFDNSSDDDY